MWYRLRVVRRPGVVFGLIYRRLDGSWTSAGEFEFNNLVVFVGEPSIACFEDFTLIEGLMLRIEPRNCMFEVLNVDRLILSSTGTRVTMNSTWRC